LILILTCGRRSWLLAVVDTVAMVTGDGECNGCHVTQVRPMTSYVTSPPGAPDHRHKSMSLDNCMHHHASIGDHISLVCPMVNRSDRPSLYSKFLMLRIKIFVRNKFHIYMYDVDMLLANVCK